MSRSTMMPAKKSPAAAVERRVSQTVSSGGSAITPVLDKYSGGPVGLNTISASIDEEASTIEEVYEPYLIQLGFLDRTPRGRVATDRAYKYFGISKTTRSSWQQGLF